MWCWNKVLFTLGQNHCVKETYRMVQGEQARDLAWLRGADYKPDQAFPLFLQLVRLKLRWVRVPKHPGTSLNMATSHTHPNILEHHHSNIVEHITELEPVDQPSLNRSLVLRKANCICE